MKGLSLCSLGKGLLLCSLGKELSLCLLGEVTVHVCSLGNHCVHWVRGCHYGKKKVGRKLNSKCNLPPPPPRVLVYSSGH